ncbi:hypothetical protein [Dyadobacter diqingensis]|uniref:hypothetical protein n=1 Tax=Dyadobacter diqingensis TaxID=2938121 RepID=UPI0020C549C6|nr:hypothetical protein [Dyadobacter diqingensis]
MNVPVMRACNILFGVVFAVFSTFSCKKRTPGDEILSISCKLEEFTHFGISYAFKYDSGNRPTTMSRVRGGGPGYPTLFFEYKDEKLRVIFVEINGNKYPKTKFEYQNNNLSRVQNFDAYLTDYTSTTINVTLNESIDFRYTSGNKPTGLTRWFSDEKRQLYKSHESVFEYDSNGNLVRERMHVFARQNVFEADYLYEYFYDEKPNTRRSLHNFFFSGMESAPLVFSTNNMNRLRVTYDSKTFRDQAFNLVYDPSGNITTDTYQYSGIKWTCE